MNKTLHFFKEIAKIPRESGNEANIAKYLVRFAKERNLFYFEDEYHNVIIKKVDKRFPCLILQAHTDMVCVSDIANFDFDKMPIQIQEIDDYLSAINTTLGADNGIGVAQILNVLDSDFPCYIEAVFTTSEETTMDGAIHLDSTLLSGKYLLNLDGFEENTILTESAAYYDLFIEPKERKTKKGQYEHSYFIFLSGLLGGHSGYDINKKRGNAILLMAELLKSIDGEVICIDGGTKNNVFPSKAEAIINSDESIILSKISSFLDKYQKKYPNLAVTFHEIDFHSHYYSNSSLLLDFLVKFPSKALYFNEKKLVTTSLNLGVIHDQRLEIGLRSSRENEANITLEKLKAYAECYNFTLQIIGYQPGFYSDANSSFVKLLQDSSPYSKVPNVTLAHITVEVGFFQEKMKDLQVAIISSKILNAHSTKECVSITSISLTDQWLFSFIEKFNKFM